MVTVMLPSEVTGSGAVTAHVSAGSDVFVLAGNRVWRIPLPGGVQRPILATPPLLGAAGPLRIAVGGAITVSGASGQIVYAIDPDTLTVCRVGIGSACGLDILLPSEGD